MLFDKFCGIIERGFLPDNNLFLEIVKKANIFYFSLEPSEVLPRSRTEKSLNDFIMPFPCVAIEDNNDLSILIEGKPETDWIGSYAFINVGFVNRDLNALNMQHMISGKLIEENLFRIIFGGIRYKYSTDSLYATEIGVQKVILCNKEKIFLDKKIKDTPQAELDNIIPAIQRNVMTAIEEIAYMNSDNYFILKEFPNKTRKNPKKILRSHERPLYTMLKPRDIRKKLRLPEPEHKRNSPIPHDRRAHWRRINWDDPEKRRKVKVKACWIGPDSATVGNKRYKVLWKI